MMVTAVTTVCSRIFVSVYKNTIMLYYAKNNEIFYKLNDQDKTFVEVYRSPLQKRILVNHVEAVYDATLDRVTQAGFAEITEQIFDTVYEMTKAEL